ncbi:MAG TPA: FkbM family methyltransferase [Candidatus Acidoferrum sp.]|nr:FkbM family methyltransferase [Candidatus Acidoferrum sp.]
MNLLGARWQYFRSRKFEGSITTPKRFVIDTKDSLIAYWSIFVERELHDPRWAAAIRTANSPLAVDVGSNAGVFSHYVHCLNPQTEIIAFEPLPAMAKRIREMKERTGAKMTCHEQALSRESGEAWFESPHGVDGTSRFASAGGNASKFRVSVTTLDEKLDNRRITVMKIDVEGFELDVIAGGKQALARTDHVIIESEDATHLAKVTKALGPDWLRSRLAATDYLFSRKRD